MSMDMARLVPFICQEVVPGDKFRVNSEVMIRLAPMVSPVMHRINVFTHYFFVPNRLIWNEFEDFITGGPDGNKMPVMPYLRFGDLQNTGDPDLVSLGSLADYFGIPPETHSNLEISALPFRAYQMIFNEYYRDQNLMEEIPFSLESGQVTGQGDIEELCSLRTRCWEKDYFTSALPWSQRGGDVSLPISGRAPVILNEAGQSGRASQFVRNATGSFTPNTTLITGPSGDLEARQANGAAAEANIDPMGSLDAVLDGATDVTINDLRRSVRLQEWLERNARGGARYIEQILSHFGVKSSDARLQRPEYLGGGKSPVVISEVLQTSSSDSTTPQANMAGHGIAVGSSHQFSRFFEEHGYVIGILSVLPRTAYQQGVPRHFLKTDKFDYYFPEFAHLGEQEIWNAEIWSQMTGDEAKGTFGYTPRYAEYKYVPGSVHGDFRQSLDFWHLGRKFGSRPRLNKDFVQANPSKRIFAVTDQNVHSLYVHIYNNMRAIRPMPRFGTPRL